MFARCQVCQFYQFDPLVPCSATPLSPHRRNHRTCPDSRPPTATRASPAPSWYAARPSPLQGSSFFKTVAEPQSKGDTKVKPMVTNARCCCLRPSPGPAVDHPAQRTCGECASAVSSAAPPTVRPPLSVQSGYKSTAPVPERQTLMHALAHTDPLVLVPLSSLRTNNSTLYKF